MLTKTRLFLLASLLILISLPANAQGESSFDWFFDLFGEDEVVVTVPAPAAAAPVEEAEVEAEAVVVSEPEPAAVVKVVQAIVDERVDRAQFTTQVSEREPVDFVAELFSDLTDNVYFYTDIRECQGCNVKHQWIFEGEEAFVLDSVAKYPRWRWWTHKANLQYGEWTVNVLLDGNVVATRKLQYVEATPTQVQQAPLQYHTQKRALTECEEDLEYWTKQVEVDPEDEYAIFKLDKAQERCSLK